MRNNICGGAASPGWPLIIGTAVAIGLAAVIVSVIDSAAAGESAYIEAPQVLMNRYLAPSPDVDSYDDLRRKRAEQRNT